MTSLSRLSSTTLSDQVTAEVLTYMVRRKLQPGDKLPSERELMEAFGVGRSSIREGMQRLVAQGLVTVRPGRGAVVRKVPGFVDQRLGGLLSLKKKNVEDLLAARQIIEVQIVQNLTETATSEDFREIQRVIDKIRVEADRDGDVFRYAAEFHVALAEATGNTVLMRIMRMIVEWLFAGGKLIDKLPNRKRREVQLHQDLLDAIKTGDKQFARQTMLKHLQDSRSVYMQVFVEQGEGTAGGGDTFLTS